MLLLPDLDFNSEEGHYVLSRPAKSTERRHLPGYCGTLLEQYGFVLSKTAK